jgi:hypothetical protein
MKGMAWVGLVAISVAISLFFEWHTDEVTVVLAATSLLALLVGGACPKWAVVGGAIIGFSITIAHALSESFGVMRPHYGHSAPSTGDWVAMALAGVFVTGVAWVGGRMRLMMENRPAAARENIR